MDFKKILFLKKNQISTVQNCLKLQNIINYMLILRNTINNHRT